MRFLLGMAIGIAVSWSIGAMLLRLEHNYGGDHPFSPEIMERYR